MPRRRSLKRGRLARATVSRFASGAKPGQDRLAGADEDRILARLRALRSDLIVPTIAVHRGRIVKRTGDGSLIEFRSVVDAVRCAVEMQNGMVERKAGGRSSAALSSGSAFIWAMWSRRPTTI